MNERTNERTNLLLGPVVDGRPAADLVVLLDDGGRPPLGDQRTQPRLQDKHPLLLHQYKNGANEEMARERVQSNYRDWLKNGPQVA